MPSFTRIVKVVKPVVSYDGMWRCYDEKLEHEEWFVPDQWMLDCMGGRLQAYFMATWSQDNGWMFKYRVKEEKHW